MPGWALAMALLGSQRTEALGLPLAPRSPSQSLSLLHFAGSGRAAEQSVSVELRVQVRLGKEGARWHDRVEGLLLVGGPGSSRAIPLTRSSGWLRCDAGQAGAAVVHLVARGEDVRLELDGLVALLPPVPPLSVEGVSGEPGAMPGGLLEGKLEIGTELLPLTLLGSVATSVQICQDQPCRLAFLVGVGFAEKDSATSISSIKAMLGTLKENWGFSQDDITVLFNEKAGKKFVLMGFDEIRKKLAKRAKEEKKPEKCTVKVHFQGHGFHGDASKAKDAKVADADKEDKDEAFACGDADDETMKGFLWDHELVAELNSIVDSLKPFKEGNLIVELDQCFAAGMYDNLDKLPTNMNVAWSAAEDKTCDAFDSGTATPYTTGFLAAFGTGSGADKDGDKKISAEEAHTHAQGTAPNKSAGAGSKDGNPEQPTIP